MKVADVMTTKVSAVSLNSTYRELWKIIFQKRINAVPVVDKSRRLLGIITREDLLERIYPRYEEVMEGLTTVAEFEKLEEKMTELTGLKAKDLMCRRVIFTRAVTPIMRALSRMIVRRVDQLPVLTDDNRLIGMITKGDVFYTLFRQHFKAK